jgi:hypothetical protein
MRILGACALLSLALSTAGADPVPDEVVLSLRSSGTVRVPVTVNGQGPFEFVLDTGSSHTTVSSDLVDRLALPVVAKVRVSTPSGVETQPVVKVEGMAIGSARVEGLMPSVVSHARLRQMEPGVHGVVGLDFLAVFDFTVDYRRKRLIWTAEPADGHDRLPLVRAGDRRLVQLPGDDPGEPVLMVPDSGSEGFVIFERQGRTAVKVDYEDAYVGVSGLASTRAGRGARLREIRVGAVTLRNQPAVVLAREGSSSVEGDGLLPLHRFSRVSFHNREGYVVVRR